VAATVHRYVETAATIDAVVAAATFEQFDQVKGRVAPMSGYRRSLEPHDAVDSHQGVGAAQSVGGGSGREINGDAACGAVA
jgi:hypothetical protein